MVGSLWFTAQSSQFDLAAHRRPGEPTTKPPNRGLSSILLGMRYASLLLFVLAVGLGACKGSSAPQVATPLTKERTAAQIISAWRRFGYICEDGKVSQILDGPVVSYARVGPTRATDGDWYVGCEVTATGNTNVPGLQISCYRVNAATLKVTYIAPQTGTPEEKLRTPCQNRPGWPQK